MSTQPRGRLKFDRIEERDENGKVWMEVTLTFGGRPVTGRSPAVEEAETRAGIRRAALATLDAIESFVGRQFHCELQEVDRVQALGKELVVLLITISFEGRNIQLFGSCRAAEDIAEAAAKAALDATNRYVDIVLTKRGTDA
jgi:hypothetical protein